MNDLRELIGKKVTAWISENEEGVCLSVKCIITHICIDDYYFEEKWEPIYVSVNIEPLEDMGENFDYDLCNNVDLNNIRK